MGVNESAVEAPWQSTKASWMGFHESTLVEVHESTMGVPGNTMEVYDNTMAVRDNMEVREITLNTRTMDASGIPWKRHDNP